MPNPSPESSKKTTRRRPDPVRSPAEELLHFFAVDPEVGLGAREADRRRDRSEANPLYAATGKGFFACLRTVIREPVLWILLVVSVIALFFNRVALGIVCLLLTVGHTLLCAFLLRRAERVSDTMQKAYDAPLPRVLRSRRLCRVGAEAVVPGDILILHEGDLVPADCRLLRTSDFSVTERELDATDPDRPARRLDKDASAIPEDGRSPRVSPANMVYAGAVVESGSAVALVIAVGSHTHLGGLIGTLRPSHGTRRPEAQKLTARLSGMLTLILTVFIIPLIVIGIITLRDRFELLDIFLSAVSLAALGFSAHSVARVAYLSAAVRRDAALSRDAVNAADICADTDTERLVTMTDLLLLGSAALHDGIPHPHELLVGTGTCRCDRPDADPEAAAAVDLLFLWSYGRAALPASASSREAELHAAVYALVPALCEWAETDTDALLVRYRDIRPERGGVSAVVSTPEGNRRLTVSVTATPPAARISERLRASAETARHDGLSTLFLSVTDGDGEGSVRALLTYAPHTSAKTAGTVKSMEAAGIRVTALLSGVSAANARVLTACGLCDRSPSDLPFEDGRNRDIAARISEGVRAFEGCSDREIADCIRALRAEGRVVGVLSVDGRDIAHLNAADVAITCAPSVYAEAEDDFSRALEDEARTVADGLPDSDRATDLCRRRADVVVRRTSREGGGLGGVRMALTQADRLSRVLRAASHYLFLVTALRVASVLLAMLFGILPIPAPLLLFSGYAVDLLVLLALGRMPAETTPAPRRPLTDGLDCPWLTLRTQLICLALPTLLPWLVAFIARLAGAGIGDGIAGYALACLVALQTAVYITLRPRRDAAGRRRTDRIYAVTLLSLILVYVGTLAVALSTGLHPLYALLIPPIPALLYIVATAVAAKLEGKR